MLVVGLTGSIATGKSTVSKILSEKFGLPVVDADLIAKEVVLKGKPAHKEIVEYFSKFTDDLLLPDGEINRKVLGEQVFGSGNQVHLKKLNSITHPKVALEIVSQIIRLYLKGSEMIILDIPLLFEATFYLLCGKIINVVCNEKTQLKRLMARNPELGRKNAMDRIASQMPMELKSQFSDTVIKNDGTLEDLEANLRAEIGKIRPNHYWSLLLRVPVFGIFAAMWVYVVNMVKFRKLRALKK